MHSYDKDLQLFIRGERREEGWKSPWRIEQERRRAEENTSGTITAKQIKVRQEREVSRPYLVCKNCPAQISRMSTSGCCRKCSPRPRLYVRRGCIFCGQELRHVNKTGRCGKHKFMKEAA